MNSEVNQSERHLFGKFDGPQFLARALSYVFSCQVKYKT